MMLNIIVLWVCKSVYWILRKSGHHGAALPGLIAEKIRPSLLNLLTQLPEGIVIVSGTNGKTTTTHILSEVLRRSGRKVFTNHSGSNMTRGLLSSIVRFSDKRGRLSYDVAVLEVDEAYAAKLAPLLKPRATLLTNVYRDQLDRFGEIDKTAELLGILAGETSELIVYKQSDQRLAAIATTKLPARCVSFGFSPSLQDYFPDDDAWYGHHKQTTNPDYFLKSIKEGEAEINAPNGAYNIDVRSLPGWHNALNLTGAFALVHELFSVEKGDVFNGLKPPYGRGETVTYKGCELVLQLVKNPAGFRVAMDVLPSEPALIVINDGIADGRDVSWLWDVDVQSMKTRSSIATSGTRAYDMALRLKYADVQTDTIIENIPEAVLDFALAHKKGVIFLTYTAMLRIRRIVARGGGGDEQ